MEQVEETGDWDVIMVDKEVPEVSGITKVNHKYVRHGVPSDDDIPTLIVRTQPAPARATPGPQVIRLDAPDSEMLSIETPSPEVVDLDDDAECQVLDQSQALYPSSPPPLISNRARGSKQSAGKTQFRLPPDCDEVLEVRPSSSRNTNPHRAYNVNLPKRQSELPTYNRMGPKTATANILPDAGLMRVSTPFYENTSENCDIVEVDEVINIL